MPQLRFRLGLHPRPAGGPQVQYSPRPPSWIVGILLIRGGKGKEDRGGNGRGVKGEGDRGGRNGKAKGKESLREGKERREGEWRGCLPRGRLKTLAALRWGLCPWTPLGALPP